MQDTEIKKEKKKKKKGSGKMLILKKKNRKLPEFKNLVLSLTIYEFTSDVSLRKVHANENNMSFFDLLSYINLFIIQKVNFPEGMCYNHDILY